MVAEEVDLHRLVFDPSDFDKRTKKLKGTAFYRKDVLASLDPETGKRSYTSVDRADKLDQAAVDGRVEDMRARDPKRREARFAVLPCMAVNDCECLGDAKPLVVRDEAFPGNLAHCGIHNEDENRPAADAPAEVLDLYVDDVRTALLELVREVQTYGQVFSTSVEEGDLGPRTHD